jgi:A/G-specific adenine glycosylase
MLQQTTVTAVIPYYEKFMERFPQVEILAESSIEEVYRYWSGLGYYSRARNLHRASQEIKKLGQFPQRFAELLELPGLGPYTARAVSSIAFNEPVGVLDGNVIRVLCRVFALHSPFWQNSEKARLQILADQFAEQADPSSTNQALMELGATVCTPKKPTCFLCPWNSKCDALKNSEVEELPLKKPLRKKEIWVWTAHVRTKNGRLALIENNYAPFLKGTWIFPGRALKVQSKPKKFDLKHTITHHEIYIQILDSTENSESEKWFQIKDISTVNPSALIQKVLNKR